MTFDISEEDLKRGTFNHQPFNSPAWWSIKRQYPNERVIGVEEGMIRIGDRFWQTPKELRESIRLNTQPPSNFELDLNQMDGSPGHEIE